MTPARCNNVHHPLTEGCGPLATPTHTPVRRTLFIGGAHEELTVLCLSGVPETTAGNAELDP